MSTCAEQFRESRSVELFLSFLSQFAMNCQYSMCLIPETLCKLSVICFFFLSLVSLIPTWFQPY